MKEKIKGNLTAIILNNNKRIKVLSRSYSVFILIYIFLYITSLIILRAKNAIFKAYR